MKRGEKMSPEQRAAYVETQAKKRVGIQQKIRELDKVRKAYVTKERAKLVKTGDDTLDAAMIKTIRAQAVKKNFKTE